MSKTLSFTKMEGTGNDFILLDGRELSFEGIDLAGLAREMCDRHYGIGADGLIVILPSEKADLAMRIFNPDGSEPEMCGNGIRCFAKFVYDNAGEKKDVISVETLAGIIVPAIILKDGVAVGAEVDMGIPKHEGDFDLEVDGSKFKATAISMGNPHCVIFVDDLKRIRLSETGPKIENHPRFPKRTNVEFVQVKSMNEIVVSVWERGAGETLACGTGACAAVVAGALKGVTGRRAIVHLPGGDLDIEWEEDDHVVMRGPAERVFEGKYFI